MHTSPRSDVAMKCKVCRFIPRHPETIIAKGNPRLHNRKNNMACTSTVCVLVGPGVNHFALTSPPHTTSFAWLYPTLPSESLLLRIIRTWNILESHTASNWIWKSFWDFQLFNVRGHIFYIICLFIEGNTYKITQFFSRPATPLKGLPHRSCNCIHSFQGCVLIKKIFAERYVTVRFLKPHRFLAFWRAGIRSVRRCFNEYKIKWEGDVIVISDS